MPFLIFAFVSSIAGATGWVSEHEAVWDTKAHIWITPADVAARAKPGDIVVFGEQHATVGNASEPGTYIHHRNQTGFLKVLVASSISGGTNYSVSIGMEFLNYADQASVDLYRDGKMNDTAFVKAVNWGGNPFEFYREQILFKGGGRTLALNIPGAIPAHVAKAGPQDLSPAERALLPPVWERGNAAYFARFRDAMGAHVTPEKLENYFWAQSLWDDTMAWKALEHRAALPNNVLVIIVGEFHVQFGGGLPYELTHLGHSPVTTMVQVETPGWDPASLSAAVLPDPVYGEQADYIWVHSGAKAAHLQKGAMQD